MKNIDLYLKRIVASAYAICHTQLEQSVVTSIFKYLLSVKTILTNTSPGYAEDHHVIIICLVQFESNVNL